MNESKPQFGASSSEWAHFDLTLGLGADLLPVVSHPDAIISPHSSMKQKGKVPSRYNGKQQVAGFPNWTSHHATNHELATWSCEPDYGICVQTRTLRAIDMDVDDELMMYEVSKIIHDVLDTDAPVRWRANSGKCLFAFLLPGDYRKRILKVEGGIIEFLANGQQFIAAGTHPTGSRYEWTPDLPEFPEVTAEQFEAIWVALEKLYGIAPTIELGGARRRGPDLDVADKTLDYLYEKGLVTGGDTHKVFFECPFSGEHTTESNESATAYFPAGTKGYETGHFECLHAHCAHRTDGEFLTALGVYMDEVEDLGPLPVAVKRKPLKLTRNKAGAILADFGNVVQMLGRDDITKWSLALDTFRDEIMIRPFAENADEVGNWRALKDTDYSALRVQLTEGFGFKQISRDMVRDAVMLVAEKHQFDSGINWGNSLVWDGVTRIDQFFTRYYEAADTEYHRAVGAYMWTALAGRLLEPGVKADMVPVLVGKQGIGKSLGVAELVQSHELRDTIDLMERDADLARKMRGRLVLEIGELRGLHGREMESIKDFISRSDDSWVPKYQEFATKYKRRCLMIGTTNQQEFLADRSGNRRWLPVRVGQGDVAAIKREREQLWAEGVARFKKGGVEWRNAEKLGVHEHEQYRMTDNMEELISEWLHTVDEEDGSTPDQRESFTIKDVLRDALHIDSRSVGKGIEMKITGILRELGRTRKKLRVSNRTMWVWVKE